MENGRILQGRAEGRRGIPRGQLEADGRGSMIGNGSGKTYYQGRIEPSPPASKIFKKFEKQIYLFTQLGIENKYLKCILVTKRSHGVLIYMQQTFYCNKVILDESF